MATISRFMKNTVLKSASYKFVIYDSPLHFRLFGPYNRRLCSNVFEDDDNELLAINYPELIERRRKSKKLKGDHSYSPEISSKKCRKTSQLSSRKEQDKDNYFQSYMLAKELGKVESLEDFLSHEKSYSIFKKNNDLLNVPLACKLFNNCQFPNEKSMLNWIKAVDFGLQHRWMTSLGLSIGLFSFGKLLNNYRGPYDRVMSLIGCERLTTWFDFALEENCSPSKHNESIRNCIYAASFISIPACINHWNLIPLYGRLNYSLLTYIPAQLKDLKKLKDHAIFYEILEPIIKVEIKLDQFSPLEQETKDEVVNLAIQFFHYYAQFMEKQESMSYQDKQSISLFHNSTAQLLCRWSVNDPRFWYDWFEISLDRLFKINDDSRLMSKQLHSLLVVLLKSNVKSNFICNDTDLAKYLAEKIKPVLIEKLRVNGLKFIIKSQWSILIRLAMDGLHVSDSPLFTNEELKEIIDILDPSRFT